MNTDFITQNLDKIQHYLDATGNFVAEQAPLVVQEMITLGRTQAVIAVVGALIALAVCIALAFWAKAKARKGALEDPENDGWFVLSVIGFGASSIFTVVTFTTLCHGLLPWIAPRVYLLHEIKNLL